MSTLVDTMASDFRHSISRVNSRRASQAGDFVSFEAPLRSGRYDYHEGDERSPTHTPPGISILAVSAIPITALPACVSRWR